MLISFLSALQVAFMGFISGEFSSRFNVLIVLFSKPVVNSLSCEPRGSVLLEKVKFLSKSITNSEKLTRLE